MAIPAGIGDSCSAASVGRQEQSNLFRALGGERLPHRPRLKSSRRAALGNRSAHPNEQRYNFLPLKLPLRGKTLAREHGAKIVHSIGFHQEEI